MLAVSRTMNRAWHKADNRSTKYAGVKRGGTRRWGVLSGWLVRWEREMFMGLPAVARLSVGLTVAGKYW